MPDYDNPIFTDLADAARDAYDPPEPPDVEPGDLEVDLDEVGRFMAMCGVERCNPMPEVKRGE